MVTEVTAAVQEAYDAMLARQRGRIAELLAACAREPLLQERWRPHEPHVWLIGEVRVDDRQVFVTTNEGWDAAQVSSLLDHGHVTMARHGPSEESATLSIHLQVKRRSVLITRMRQVEGVS